MPEVKTSEMIELDPAHLMVDPFDTDLVQDVIASKYMMPDEKHPHEMFARVARGVFPEESELEDRLNSETYMRTGLMMPGGRILAGAGTDKVVTLMNCYVMGTIGDSMSDIGEILKCSMLTSQQGGGIGMDFSTLRPEGAVLRRTGAGSEASGPLPFMDTWNAMCKTIMSAGARRGAMMGTLCISHPDLVKFIEAKSDGDRLRMFNVSILVSDAFMYAVETNDSWYLHFPIPPVGERSEALKEADFEDEDGNTQYVYSIWKARDLWELITKYTYEHSEPGVIFIDRINDLNNLYYREEIRCTNPCGEQPLPPWGACNLGAVNLARIVKNPFTSSAEIDYDLLGTVTKQLVRFLDKVIDVTNYPLVEQQLEQETVRRVGVGISGLADCLVQLKIAYNSHKAGLTTRDIMRHIAISAYEESASLAQEKGPFPAFLPESRHNGAFMDAAFLEKLPPSIVDQISTHGIRNGTLLTIAPTGTTSIAYGNISSSLEPIFAFEMDRNVLQKDDTWKKYVGVQDYAVRLFKSLYPDDPLPSYFKTINDLTVEDHIRIQAACQSWVDASVSKTINCPKDISYEDFKHVYQSAYDQGCKGCTTYRPSDARGVILSVSGEDKDATVPAPFIPTRPDCLKGYTYKVKWPSWNAAMYMTINHGMDEDDPFEIFIQSKDARHQEWITAMTLMISAILRRGGDVAFIAEELKQVQSTHDSAWLDGKHYGSVVSKIGHVIEQHFQKVGLIKSETDKIAETDKPVSFFADTDTDTNEPSIIKGEICPICNAPALIMMEGCKKCQNCVYSSCG